MKEAMSRPLNLYRLQQIDSKVDQADARLKEIEVLLSDNANLRKATMLANRAEMNLEAAKKEQRQAEKKVKDQRIKIEHAEATLYGGAVRNPKELQDLQNEVAALRRFLDTLEERQLEAMLNVDDVQAQYQKAQQTLQKYRDQAENQQAGLMQEREQIQNERIASLNQRQGAENVIIPDDLATYYRLRKQRGGVAVAKVEDRACNACGSTLTAALYQAARSPSQVVFCASCGRIVTKVSEKIKVQGRHDHSFGNLGYLVKLGCFRNAPGCIGLDRISHGYSWFRGYAWQIQLCRHCLTQLGWKYMNPDDRFYGLIFGMLREEESEENHGPDSGRP